MGGRRWTAEEIGILKAGIGVMPLVDIADTLGRHPNSIYAKVAELRLEPGHVKRDQPEKRRRVKEAIAEAALRREPWGIAKIAKAAGLRYKTAWDVLETLIARGEVEKQCRYRVVGKP